MSLISKFTYLITQTNYFPMNQISTRSPWLAICFVLLTSILAQGAPLHFLPMKLQQPDGSLLYCYASGDEFHNWLHDNDGFTIIQHPKTGFYVYARQAGAMLEATELIPGIDNPRSHGLTPYSNIPAKNIQAKRNLYQQHMERPIPAINLGQGLKSAPEKNQSERLSNLVIFIQFADENISNEDFSYYQNLYNASAGPSLVHYFKDVTNNQMEINTSFFPKPSGNIVSWYKDTQTRKYFQPYNAATNPIGYKPNEESGPDSRNYREHQLLKRAIEGVSSQIPSDFEVDALGDGFVDCVSFIVSGSPDGWSDLLWPHRWSLWSADAKVEINGKRVWDYTFQLQFEGTQRMRLGTVAHEMFHVLGAPDLYRYENTTMTPVGIWDLMASTPSHPQQMTAYMKYYYGGWIQNIPLITQTGTYQLNPLQSSSQNAYRIPVPNSHKEFFVVEYRNNQYTYDTSLPGSGLISYRINRNAEGDGNADGPPDELYIMRPNASAFNDGILSQANHSASSGRTAIHSQSTTNPFLSDASAAGIYLHNIGNPGATLSFSTVIDYDFPRLINHYKGPSSSIGPGQNPKTFSVASRFTAADLTDFNDQFLTKVEFKIASGGGTDVTAQVWKGNGSPGPGQLIYEKNISPQVQTGGWTTHQLEQSIALEPATDYWIGYTMNATGGYPIVRDKGPLVLNKGGWIKWNTNWQQITDFGISANFFIAGVVERKSLTPTSNQKIPQWIVLGQNYPNPFVTQTTIPVMLEKPARVTIKVYNSIGQEVAVVANHDLENGLHEIPFSASHLPAGVYFYQMTIAGEGLNTTTRRMLIQSH